MSIVDWVYVYPGTLEALIERQWDASDIFEMSTAQALDYAKHPIHELGASSLLTLSDITYESAMLLQRQLGVQAEKAEVQEGA